MRRVVSNATATGLFFVAGFLLLTVGIVFYSLTCSGTYCGIAIILPVMPWLLLLGSVLPDTTWTYFLIVGLNSLLLFFIGRYIGTLIIEREHRKHLHEI